MPKATRRTGQPVRTDQPIPAVYEIEKPDPNASKDPTGIRGEIHDWHHKLSRVTGTLVLAFGRRGFKKAELVQFSKDLRHIADRFDQISGLTEATARGPLGAVDTTNRRTAKLSNNPEHDHEAVTPGKPAEHNLEASRASLGNRVRPKARRKA